MIFSGQLPKTLRPNNKSNKFFVQTFSKKEAVRYYLLFFNFCLRWMPCPLAKKVSKFKNSETCTCVHLELATCIEAIYYKMYISACFNAFFLKYNNGFIFKKTMPPSQMLNCACLHIKLHYIVRITLYFKTKGDGSQKGGRRGRETHQFCYLA